MYAVTFFSFPGSAWERTAARLLPRGPLTHWRTDCREALVQLVQFVPRLSSSRYGGREVEAARAGRFQAEPGNEMQASRSCPSQVEEPRNREKGLYPSQPSPQSLSTEDTQPLQRGAKPALAEHPFVGRASFSQRRNTRGESKPAIFSPDDRFGRASEASNRPPFFWLSAKLERGTADSSRERNPCGETRPAANGPLCIHVGHVAGRA